MGHDDVAHQGLASTHALLFPLLGVTSLSYPMANATTSGDIMDDIIPEVTSSDYALVMMASFNRVLLARGPR